MAELELRGYLTTGKFQVNDYTIEIERVGEGVRLRVTDGDGNVQQAIVKDGEPGLNDSEAAQLRSMYETLSEAFPQWQSAEAARVAAERLRNIAENGDPDQRSDPETDAEKKLYRKGLYELTLALYNRLYPKVDNDLAAINSAKSAAQSAKTAAEAAEARAEQAASDAYRKSLGNFATDLYYFKGDRVIIASGDPSNTNGDDVSHYFNASGYCSSGSKYIHLKFPVAKRLDNITNITCQSLKVNIANHGGYGLTEGYKSGGSQYSGYIDGIHIDKVQNCIHVTLHREDGFNLTNNDCVNARIGTDSSDGTPAIQFTMSNGAVRPNADTDTDTTSNG